MSTEFSNAQLERAIEALSDPERFRAAERRVAAAAPQLQKVLINAMSGGGWFDDAHVQQLSKVASIESADERLTALRTLMADEARMTMMVGVAVGWELAVELGS